MLRNLNVGLRSALLFSVFGLIALFLGVFALSQLDKFFTSSSELGNERMPRITLTGNMRVDFLSARFGALAYTLVESEQDKQAVVAQTIQNAKDYIANGDLSHKFRDDAKDEAGDLIRALARRTQESTEDIMRMINEVQTNTQAAVQNMQKSSTFASTTMEISGELDQALSEVVSFIAKINEQNLNIASAAEEQAMVARALGRAT
ncbi:MAG: methyl-accepting chemotaxis protein [Venatoribacter sp.]